MYSCMEASKEAVSVTLLRKELCAGLSVRFAVKPRHVSGTYKRPVRVLSVEMDEALKAGHCVELAKEMQLWAMPPGIVVAARTESSKLPVLTDVVIWRRFDRWWTSFPRLGPDSDGMDMSFCSCSFAFFDCADIKPWRE